MSTYLTSEECLLRQRRATIFYATSAALALLAAVYLIWALRAMILPLMIGMIMAYICLPLIGYLKGKGFSRFWAVIFLSAMFCLLLFSTINLTGKIIPNQKEELELQVRVRYKVNEKFDQMMGTRNNGRGGNLFYTIFGKELEPLRSALDSVLRLSDKERELFTIFHYNPNLYGYAPVADRYWQYYQANRQRDQKEAELQAEKQAQEKSSGVTPHIPQPEGRKSRGSLLLLVFNALSLWLITPLVFLILLFDDGKLKRNLVQAVPNRYFEVTLTVFDSINEALGRYLRGTAIECFLVGTSFTLSLFLVGLEMQWAATIGVIAGLANAIPFLGPVIGLLVGILYAILTEQITPILPFINEGNLLLAIIAVVALVQLADNAIFQPYVLGSAVNLHPLVVIVGVMGGAVIFSFAGMLFAIPAIMVIKVVVTTMFRQLRAYYII
ncbi:MAG: AI-2E family transporter [Proteobacteria bacterium]|nr:AI-2E family transporter [Pseudomonadota bacterium]MBU1736997.1 AI-2E family transporter [Pseudomonadota bacterium]